MKKKRSDRHAPSLYVLLVRLDKQDKARLKKYTKLVKKKQTDIIRELIRNHCVDYERD